MCVKESLIFYIEGLSKLPLLYRNYALSKSYQNLYCKSQIELTNCLNFLIYFIKSFCLAHYINIFLYISGSTLIRSLSSNTIFSYWYSIKITYIIS